LSKYLLDCHQIVVPEPFELADRAARRLCLSAFHHAIDQSLAELGRFKLGPGPLQAGTELREHVAHAAFAGWRADEFETRLGGVSYRDLHGEEGGIFRSARQLAMASDDAVMAFCLPLVAEMAAHGTTTLELKTGYGLGVEQELRQARLARRLADEVPQTCTVTLLACHAVPDGVTKADWVRAACSELIPDAAAEGLADAVDIYVEDIAFSLEDLSAVAEAAAPPATAGANGMVASTTMAKR
jgi:imidazolonepropionase